MEIRMGRRVVHSPHAHMVFVTERRGKVFNIAHLKRLEEICRDVRSDFEAEPQEFNGERNHVHLLVIYPPKVRLSELANSLKGVSSRRLKAEFPAISTFSSVRKSEAALWPPNDFVGSVGGALLTSLQQDIENHARSEPAARTPGPVALANTPVSGCWTPGTNVLMNRLSRPGVDRCRLGHRGRTR